MTAVVPIEVGVSDPMLIPDIVCGCRSENKFGTFVVFSCRIQNNKMAATRNLYIESDYVGISNELLDLEKLLLERPNLFAVCKNTFSKWWENCTEMTIEMDLEFLRNIDFLW
jgi:hypothetical protein